MPGLEAEGPEALHDYINQTVETAATSDAPAETEGVQTAPASMDLAADDWLVIEDVEDEAPHHSEFGARKSSYYLLALDMRVRALYIFISILFFSSFCSLYSMSYSSLCMYIRVCA